MARAYKHLWMVEAIFRSMQSVLETRPIYHQRDEHIRGHVFCSFLALVLRQELERRLAARRWSLEWTDMVRDLDALHETTITIDGHAYLVRSEAKRTVGRVFRACGVAIPPALRSAEAPGLPLGYPGNPEADVSLHKILGCKCLQAQDFTLESVQGGLDESIVRPLPPFGQLSSRATITRALRSSSLIAHLRNFFERPPVTR